MRICVLASGSQGNCCYIESGGYGLLIDIGISVPQLVKRCQARGIQPDAIHGAFLSHGHQDHVKGALRWWSDNRLRHGGSDVIWASKQALVLAGLADKLQCCAIRTHEPIRFHGFVVTALGTIHNAEGAYAFSITEAGTGKRALFIGETGRVTKEMEELLPECDALLIEANHDPQMVADNDKLPDLIKQRIVATHTSNAGAAAAIRKVRGFGGFVQCKLVVALHRSAENNDSELCRTVLGRAIDSAAQRLVLAEQAEPTEVFTV